MATRRSNKRKRARQKATHRGDAPRFPLSKCFNAKGVLAGVIQPPHVGAIAYVTSGTKGEFQNEVRILW